MKAYTRVVLSRIGESVILYPKYNKTLLQTDSTLVHQAIFSEIN